jgi:hypothetical protein
VVTHVGTDWTLSHEYERLHGREYPTGLAFRQAPFRVGVVDTTWIVIPRYRKVL